MTHSASTVLTARPRVIKVVLTAGLLFCSVGCFYNEKPVLKFKVMGLSKRSAADRQEIKGSEQPAGAVME